MLLYIAIKDAHKIYSDKFSEGTCRSNALFSAGWTVEELQKLMEEHQNITANVNALVGFLEDEESVPPGINLSQSLTKIREQLTIFVRSLYRHKRQPASNIYVMMISSELRQVKPYALPIQRLPYKSIKENTMRTLVGEVVKVMRARGMKVVGMCNLVQVNLKRLYNTASVTVSCDSVSVLYTCIHVHSV